METDGLAEQVRNVLAIEYCRMLGLPMDLADGRPWVRTHAEQHDPAVWGGGSGGCGHPDCGGGSSNVVGLFGADGIERQA